MARKPKYQTVAGQEDDGDVDDAGSNSVNESADDILQHKDEDSAVTMNVTVLDFTHRRFVVPVTPDATVQDLKAAGVAFHAVPVDQQRLIFQGKLLQDEATLTTSRIVENSIVHLFPKPRVVVVSDEEPQNDTESDEGGPRVPRIVMDEEEAARRGQILVLGSTDYIEALNNVKLFSFMLLIISTIELLNLMAIAMGDAPSGGAADVVPFPDHDDFFSDDDGLANHTAANTTDVPTTTFTNPNETWTPLSWVDLGVSILGVYVALLGIRATNENGLRVARLYLLGTCVTGVGWLLYNFMVSLEVDEAKHATGAENYPPNESAFDEATQAMMLPVIVWGFCVFRAWQFQHLLAEAEQEAFDRAASEDDEESALHVS